MVFHVCRDRIAIHWAQSPIFWCSWSSKMLFGFGAMRQSPWLIQFFSTKTSLPFLSTNYASGTPSSFAWVRSIAFRDPITTFINNFCVWYVDIMMVSLSNIRWLILKGYFKFGATKAKSNYRVYNRKSSIPIFLFLFLLISNSNSWNLITISPLKSCFKL